MTTTPIAAGPNDVTVRAALDAGIAVMAGDMAALADAPTWEELQRFAGLIVAAEREACLAAVQGVMVTDHGLNTWKRCVSAIEKRSN